MPTDTILAVDDEEPILELYRRIFCPRDAGDFDILGEGDERPSLPVLRCRTYLDPTEMVEDYRRDFQAGLRLPVCILDIMMRQQSGYETARQLRAIDPDIEIVVCTADPGTAPLVVGEELGDRAFFVRKPPNTDEFALMVHALIRSWHERRKLRRRTAMLRRRAETMRRQTAFLGGLVELVPDLVFMKDAKGLYLKCNKNFARCFGLEPDDIVGRTDGAFLPEECCRLHLAQDRQVLTEGKPVIFREQVKLPDGSFCLLETVKSPVYSAAGECIGLIGVGRDITECGKFA